MSRKFRVWVAFRSWVFCWSILKECQGLTLQFALKDWSPRKRASVRQGLKCSLKWQIFHPEHRSAHRVADYRFFFPISEGQSEVLADSELEEAELQ